MPTRLFYDDAVCGNAEDFSARVMRRNGAVRFVSNGESVVVRLRIERREGALDARVTLSGRGRAPMSRRIESPDCDDALDALALVVAIGIEGRSQGARAKERGRARVRRAAPPPAAPAPEPAPPPTPEPEAPEPPPEPPPPAPAPAPVAPAPVVAPPPSPAPEPAPLAPPPSGLTLGAGLSALASLGVAPAALWGAAVYVVAGWETPGVWAPELLLGLSHQWLDGFEQPGGDARFELDAANVELCPVRWAIAALTARPCAAAWLGRFGATGDETYAARSTTRPWATLGASAELNARFGPIELRGAIGAGAPLARDRFRFGGPCSGTACEQDAFHRVSPVVWSFALGAGAGFW